VRTSGGYLALSPDALAARLADRIAACPAITRIAIDGPPCAFPHELADSLIEPLRALGRPVAPVRTESFWRDASLRFEHGKQDADSYLDWLDPGALRREVLEPAVAFGTYVPSLRDPATNRATRVERRPVPDRAVLLVSGTFLLGLGLPFDLSVHLAVSPAARKRRTPRDEAWTLPAFDRYDAEVEPGDLADVVVRLDDPRHPAVRGLG
jgi:hypothetical protein